jgi:DNA-binding response OmpR family regulator
MSNEKVLLIDGDPGLCEEVADFLWEQGYKVESASSNGSWQQRQDWEDFDIVILDRKMAGADGLENLARIKALAPESRMFLACGAPAARELLRKEEIAGLVAGVIEKPYRAANLLGALGND